jgi:hypothetical protein
MIASGMMRRMMYSSVFQLPYRLRYLTKFILPIMPLAILHILSLGLSTQTPFDQFSYPIEQNAKS